MLLIIKGKYAEGIAITELTNAGGFLPRPLALICTLSNSEPTQIEARIALVECHRIDGV
jgi:hypothetical protein